MKIILTITLLLISFLGYSQTHEIDTIGYRYIVEVDSSKTPVQKEKLTVIYCKFNQGMSPDSLFKWEHTRRFNENYFKDRGLTMYKSYFYYEPVLRKEYPTQRKTEHYIVNK